MKKTITVRGVRKELGVVNIRKAPPNTLENGNFRSRDCCSEYA